jgi:hypothetical protein
MLCGAPWSKPGRGALVLGPRRRAQDAAQQYFRPLLKGVTEVPRVRITNTGPRYSAVKREPGLGVEPRQPSAVCLCRLGPLPRLRLG